MTATMEKTQLDYYSFDKVLSYNAMFNFVIGARGLGKTYGAKDLTIGKAIRTHGEEQFILVRRYKDELRMSRDTFFADIGQEFPEYHFRHLGMEAQMSHVNKAKDKNRAWITIGYFIPLSIAQSVKGASFPKVKWIIFDEFIIEKGKTQYLPDEAKAFQNFYSTVDRWKDKTRVLFLANSVSIMNPYFIAYDIKPELGKIKRYKIDPETGIAFMVVHFADSADFTGGVLKTKFGRFIEGTDYADYAVGNEFKDNGDNLIKEKTPQARYRYTLETARGIFSVWYDSGEQEYYVQEKRPGQEILMTMVHETMDENKSLLAYSDKLVQYLRTSYKQGKLYCDTPKSRNAFTEIFKR